MTSTSACVFCEIVAGERRAYRVYEDDETIAFLDAAPAVPGHTLIVPKAHYETLPEMDELLVGRLFQTVRTVAAAIDSVHDPDGLSVVQSNGAAAGQDVFHVHVHLVPRYEDDEVSLQWTPGELTEEANREIAAALRDEL